MSFVLNKRWALLGALLVWPVSGHAQDTVKVGQLVANLVCADKPIGCLLPHWFQKMGVVRRQQEFYFSD